MIARPLLPLLTLLTALVVPPAGLPAQQPAQPKPAAQPDPADPAPPEEKPLPKIEDMKVPSVAELLQGKRICWVVTNKDEVIVSEPVRPRPFTRQTMDQLILDWPKGKTPKQRRDLKTEFDRLHFLTVVLPGVAEEPEYQLPIRFLKDVIHHETLMLRRIDLLMDDQKFRTAFEMLLALEQISPPKRVGKREVFWPGYEDRRNRLMLLEAEAKIGKKRYQSALVYLEDLKVLTAEEPLDAADSRYAGFRTAFKARFAKAAGAAAEPLIASAVAAKDYRRARFFLRDRLPTLVTDHPVEVRWRQTLESQQQDLLKRSQAATGGGRHDEAAGLVEQAARIWPFDARGQGNVSIIGTYSAATSRFQTLRVGVVTLSGSPSVCPFPTESDRRHTRLVTETLFEVDRFENIPYYTSNFFEQYEPTDLGRQVEFTLRPKRASWQAGPAITAAPIVSMLTQRIDPTSPLYDERLATFVSGLMVRSPHEFVLRFSRVPVKPEALLRTPVVAVATGDQDELKVLSRRFRVHDRGPRHAVYRREVPEADGLGEYHVAEVREIKYDSYHKALQGLLRGEFSMLPRMPAWNVDVFLKNDRLQQQYFVVPYTVPTTHVIQFNPKSKPLRNSQLRRALAFAIDRPKVLAETVLKDPTALSEPNKARGRLVTAPFPLRSYAYLQQVTPRPHSPILAISLRVVADGRITGGLPTLKMLCPDEPIVRAAAEEFVKQWKRIGINVTLLDTPATDAEPPADWDLAYRTLQMTEPIVELWPFLTMQPMARVGDLMYMPDWIRQELISLDRAENFAAAVIVLHRLHRLIQDRVLMLPLWEVDEVMVIPRNIKGFSLSPLNPYQGLERWTIQSKLPQDTLPQARPQ